MYRPVSYVCIIKLCNCSVGKSVVVKVICSPYQVLCESAQYVLVITHLTVLWLLYMHMIRDNNSIPMCVPTLPIIAIS